MQGWESECIGVESIVAKNGPADLLRPRTRIFRFTNKCPLETDKCRVKVKVKVKSHLRSTRDGTPLMDATPFQKTSKTESQTLQKPFCESFPVQQPSVLVKSSARPRLQPLLVAKPSEWVFPFHPPPTLRAERTFPAHFLCEDGPLSVPPRCGLPEPGRSRPAGNMSSP